MQCLIFQTKCLTVGRLLERMLQRLTRSAGFVPQDCPNPDKLPIHACNAFHALRAISTPTVVATHDEYRDIQHLHDADAGCIRVQSQSKTEGKWDVTLSDDHRAFW